MSSLSPSLLLPVPRAAPRGAALRTRAASAASAAAAAEAGEIGEGGENASLYEVLGVAEGEGRAEEIKTAYRRMARRFHPDAAPPGRKADHARRFIAVRRAYDTLSDPARRALYDGRLRLACSTRLPRPPQELDERLHWRKHWQDQIAELYWRSINKDSEINNLSWGAQMRRKMNGPSY